MKKLTILILCAAVLLAGCTPAGTPAVQLSSIQYSETAPVIRLSYDQALTGRVEAALIPAVPAAPDQPFYVVHPAYVQLGFPQYATDRTFQMPYPLDIPQMMVYQTRDFAGYGDASLLGYSSQLTRLNDLLENGFDPARCAKQLIGEDGTLPFLPMLNQAQVFCAKLQRVAFEGGEGLRFVTYYDQGPAPKFEARAFYTFQGRTDDGQFYISVILPVRTNVLPDEQAAPSDDPDLEALAALLQQITAINAQADDGFTPSLSQLDALIAGVKVPGE